MVKIENIYNTIKWIHNSYIHDCLTCEIFSLFTVLKNFALKNETSGLIRAELSDLQRISSHVRTCYNSNQSKETLVKSKLQKQEKKKAELAIVIRNILV